MATDTEWATDREIQAASDMLETRIAVYSRMGTGYVWQVFDPISAAQGEDDNLNLLPMIYIENISHHFEPVIRM